MSGVAIPKHDDDVQTYWFRLVGLDYAHLREKAPVPEGSSTGSDQVSYKGFGSRSSGFRLHGFP